MPTLAEALKFVRDPQTDEARLRRACAILYMDTNGSAEVLRERLLNYLKPLDANQEIVCLNPRMIDPDV